MERLDSLQHEDIWNEMEFELDRFMRYERFRCDYQKEKGKSIELYIFINILCVSDSFQQLSIFKEGKI